MRIGDQRELAWFTASDGPLAYTWRACTGQRVTEGMLHQSPVRVAAYGPNSRHRHRLCRTEPYGYGGSTGAANEARPRSDA